MSTGAAGIENPHKKRSENTRHRGLQIIKPGGVRNSYQDSRWELSGLTVISEMSAGVYA